MVETGAHNLDERLEEARGLLADGRLDNCLDTLKQLWLAEPSNGEIISLLAELMKQADEIAISDALTNLAGKFSDNGESASKISPPELADCAQESFEAAYRLIDARQFELAAMLLSNCTKAAPDDPTVNYELGFSLMSLSRYEEARIHFETVLKLEEDFDTCLNLSVCYCLTREFDESQSMLKRLEKLAQSDEEQSELKHRKSVLARQKQLRNKKSLSCRDWFFILYGTILLFDPSDKNQKEKQNEKESFRDIAFTLVVLKGLLEGLRHVPEAIEFYSPTSRPLSAIIARLFDLPLNNYMGPDRPDHALMLMDWASEIIGPHRSFTSNQPNRSIFAYGLSTTQTLPLIPEIIGHFSNDLLLPWSGESQITLEESDQARTPEEVIPEILEKAWNLESDPDALKVTQDLVEYYSDKLNLLVICNNESFPIRPEYSAEIPLISSKKAKS